MGSETFSLIGLLIGVYLLYAAITGKGKLYENEYVSCSKEQYDRGLRRLSAVSGALLTLTNGLQYAGIVQAGSLIGIIFWALGFSSLVLMMIFTTKHTDKKAAAAGRKTVGGDEKPKDPLRAAFVFDDEPEEKENNNKEKQEKR